MRDERVNWEFARRGFGGVGRGFGPFGPNSPGGRGGSFLRAGKMIADGDLRLIVLALLEEKPRHGYDIIKALEELSSGVYSPSPGVVYPTLTYLEDTGYAAVASEGNKKTYSITDAGREHLKENRELTDSVLGGIENFGRKFASAREWFGRTTKGDGQPDRDTEGVSREVNAARRALKEAIAEKIGAPEETQRRLATILSDAAAAIRALPGAPKGDETIDL
jgi:DNA-binding PadR family transcriptional regulator